MQRSSSQQVVCYSCLIFGLLILGCNGKKPATDPTLVGSSPRVEPEFKPLDDTTALGAVQVLFLAMLSDDEQTIRRVIKPHPDAAVLWENATSAPPGALEEAKAQLLQNPGRLLVPGETLTLRGNRTFVVKEGMISEDRQLIWPRLGAEEGPLPLWVNRQDGRWIVDASPIIGMRLSAKKKREEGK